MFQKFLEVSGSFKELDILENKYIGFQVINYIESNQTEILSTTFPMQIYLSKKEVGKNKQEIYRKYIVRNRKESK